MRTKTIGMILGYSCIFSMPCVVAQGDAMDADDICTLIACEKPAATKPLWEIGFGGGAAYGAHYPAADDYQSNIFGFPYFVYRGKVFRVGDGGIARAVAVENERVEIDFSFSGSFNARSEDNSARAGMPDLDYIFEVGPQLVLHSDAIDYQDNSQGMFNFRWHLRGVYSTDFSQIANQGYVTELGLSYSHVRFAGTKAKLSAGVASTFATSPLQAFFYSVPAQFQTAQRPEYHAKSGYLGTEIKLGAAVPVTDDVRVFISTKCNTYAGAANTASPLYRDKYNYSFGLGLIWRLFESETRVKNLRPD